ncbi:ATP-dependent Clp protease ATP-binding subunit [Intestinibacillus massiliensis]|uniref:ATP-dependent Clp protease ATP-binding subunit n=1 Tax=Intestinibacillus massiliensis TaxID=1871029 RepID=UPI000B3554F5|nr:ATP-dependent Clp protease ATP-binding subunit [Intestinibacillus massiliensis]
MQMPMCSRCGKNIAVVFITKMENSGATTHEGICLKCAKELGIKPVDSLMEQMGITEDDLEALSGEMETLAGAEGLVPMDSDGDGDSDGDEPENVEDLPGGAEDGEGDDGSTTRSFPFLEKLFQQGQAHGGPAPSEDAASSATRTEKRDPKKDKKRKFLTGYCDDLTAKARDGRIDRIVGRDRETERVIQILNRRQKNNPCLIGEPGVGKTAVAEGLALRIAEGKVPYKLQNKEIHLLDLTALVAGTQFRGQFESRMKGLIDEVKRLGNIILVIDEVHNIVGAGDSEGSMNAANILKPALSRGEIQVIGATTYNEYRKYIEKDAALERRFQPVTVAEPSIADTVEILKGIRTYYEAFHGVTISDAICRQAAQLSERYITDRFLPDKAIDLIDEACSRVNLENPAVGEIPRLQNELDKLEEEREALLQEEQNERTYERMAMLQSHALQVQGQLDTLRQKPAPALDAEHLAQVIELWTGIPASKVCEIEFSRLQTLEERLKEHVIGQDEAIGAIGAAIRRSRAGISPKKKPVSFLFVGPTGVGKTELVKRLAADLFDTPESLIRFDMSEFMEKHTVSRLVGSPPGYVGYDEAGQLTEKIRRRPYSVVLFDEIEKAHPDVLNILLQILDDGRITDAHGRVVNFENAVIVMTSNAGSQNKSVQVGFGKTVSEQAKDRAMKALESLMRPEFLNRIDEIVAFNQLSEADFTRIAGILLGELRDSLAERAIRLTWDASLVDYLVKKAFSVQYGARNLRRLIEKEVENALAAEIVASWEHPLAGAHITAQDGKLSVQTI